MNVTKFTTWTQENRGISDFTKWLLSSHSILLSDDVYVPTFHETLAEYCKREWQLSGTSGSGVTPLYGVSVPVDSL